MRGSAWIRYACAPVAAIADDRRDSRGRGRRRRNPRDDKDGREPVDGPRGQGRKGNAVLARDPFPRARTARDGGREKRSFSGARDGARGRAAAANAAEGEATGAARPRDKARAAALEREKERRASRLLARSAVGSHGCAAYLYLLSPLFSLLRRRQPEPPRRAPRSAPPLLGPACAPLSISLSLRLARRPSSPSSGSLLLLRFASFLSFSADSRFFTYNRT